MVYVEHFYYGSNVFVTDRLQYVTLDNQRSHITSVASRIPQGTVLAPAITFLIIYQWSSLSNTQIRSKVKLYADDVLLYSHIKFEGDCQLLQEDLEALVQWAHNWQMEFNFQKHELLKIIKLTNKKNPLVFNYCIASKLIRQVSHTKYLGLIFGTHTPYDFRNLWLHLCIIIYVISAQ